MSTEQRIALALRKERLLVLAGQQRAQLAQWGGYLRKPCAVADKAMAAGRYVKGHPWAAGVVVGVAALLGRRHVFRLAGYTWSAWRTWRLISNWSHKLGLMNRLKKQ